MNAKQRKQAETIRAAALAGLEQKQESVAKQIEVLMALKKEQEWYEKSRTAAADVERNERAIARLEQHQSLEEAGKALDKKREELISLAVDVESREDKLSLNQARFDEHAAREAKRLDDLEGKLDERRNLLDIANKPVKETINEILMMLELDETPEEIAAIIRKKHNILVPTW